MRRVGLIILVCVCAGCTSPESERDAETVPMTRPLPASTTEACATDNDALAVAKTFVVAAESGDQATIARCTYAAAPLTPDLLAIVASGGWLLDQVRSLPEHSSLRLGPGAVGFDFPAPPQSRGTYIDDQGHSVSFGPDYQSGLMVVVTLEPDGLRYVTDALAYGSA